MCIVHLRKMKYVINLFHRFTFYNTIPKIHKCAQKGTVYKLGMARYNFLKSEANTETATWSIRQYQYLTLLKG